MKLLQYLHQKWVHIHSRINTLSTFMTIDDDYIHFQSFLIITDYESKAHIFLKCTLIENMLFCG